MTTFSRETEAPVYDLRVHATEREPLPSTARAQLFVPRSDTETPTSLIERMKAGFLKLVKPKK